MPERPSQYDLETRRTEALEKIATSLDKAVEHLDSIDTYVWQKS